MKLISKSKESGNIYTERLTVMVIRREFMFSAKRDKKAAKRFLKKALKARHNRQPRVINVDKNPADPAAIEELKEEGIFSNECELRQKKFLNNIIEQDHRFPKKLAKYKSYAWCACDMP